MYKLLLLLMLGLLVAHEVGAVVPNTMSVQGRLLNAGSPMNGTHPATFKIYDAASVGSLLWTEDNTLDVLNGVYSAILGQTTPLPTLVFSSPSRWLEVTVDGNTLAPRLALTTSAYAFRAQRADTAEVALSRTGGNELWSTDGTNVWRGGGSVGIGTSSPTSALEVSGVGQFMDDGASPDTKAYATLGVTRTPSLANLSYLGLTKQGILPWGIGISSGNHLIFGIATPSPERTIPTPLVSIHPFTGHVGVGTSAPSYSLDVHSSDYLHGMNWQVDNGTEVGSFVRFGSNNARGALFIGNDNVGGTFGPDVGALLQTTGGWQWNKQLNIMGPVGINTNSPSAMLTVGGDAYISGNLNVSGTKCRIVPSSTYGALYYNAIESAHALFTTEGQGSMDNGVASVSLDPKWLTGVTIDEQHPMQVWITFYGAHGDYYVDRAATHDGFTVVDPSRSCAAFGWKVEARQRGYEELYLSRPEATAAQQGERP